MDRWATVHRGLTELDTTEQLNIQHTKNDSLRFLLRLPTDIQTNQSIKKPYLVREEVRFQKYIFALDTFKRVLYNSFILKCQYVLCYRNCIVVCRLL